MVQLKSQKCSFENCKLTAISVNGENPYCRQHCSLTCCLRNKNNVFGDIRCNSSVKMIKHKCKMYCNSHFRTLIKTCNNPQCNKKRKSNELCHDKMWYCSNHKLDQNILLNSIENTLGNNNIPNDISKIIFKKHLKNNSYRI